MTNGSVTTQDTSVSTPSSSPSPTANSRDEFREGALPPAQQRGDLTLTKSVNLLANVPQKSETVKASRPIIGVTTSLPLQPEMSTQSVYATLGARHSNPTPQFVHPNYATTQRRASPTGERRPPTVTLVTASTSNPANEGTLQKVKRIYL
jgi:hypothetical protein